MKELRLLLPFLRRYRWRYAIGALCVVGAVLLRILIPRLLGNSIDDLRSLSGDGGEAAAETGEIRRLLVLGALWIAGAAALGAVVRTTSRLMLLGGSRRVIHDIRERVFDHLLRLAPSFYTRTQTGDLMSRAVNDVQFTQGLMGPVFMYLAETGALFVVCLSFMLGVSWELTLLGMLPFPVFLFVARRLAARVQQGSREAQAKLAEISSKVDESLSGHMVVKALALEEFDAERFARRCDDYRRQNLQVTAVRGNMGGLMIGLGSLSTLIVLAVGGPRVIAGNLSLGDFVAMVLYFQILATPVGILGFVMSSLQRGTAALSRLRELLETAPTLEDPAEPVELPPGSGALEVRDLTVRFRGDDGAERTVLDRVSFALPAGRTLGVVGHVGSGKSVLLEALARQLEVEPGHVFLDGVDVTSLRLADARRAVGFVPQEAFLFSAPLAENLALGRPEATREEILRSLESAGLAKDMDQFPDGLDTLVGERGLNVSGGQRQRAALARVLLLKPRVMLFDDPFSAVDTQTTQEILSRLRPLVHDRTAVIVAHRVATVQGADHILVLEEGRIVEQGSAAELLRLGGRYAALHAKQQSVDSLVADLERDAMEEEVA